MSCSRCYPIPKKRVNTRVWMQLVIYISITQSSWHQLNPCYVKRLCVISTICDARWKISERAEHLETHHSFCLWGLFLPHIALINYQNECTMWSIIHCQFDRLWHIPSHDQFNCQMAVKTVASLIRHTAFVVLMQAIFPLSLKLIAMFHKIIIISFDITRTHRTSMLRWINTL